MIAFKCKIHALITLFIMYSTGYLNIWWLFGGIVGSYIPDCDHEYGPFASLLPLYLFIKHRTYTHSLIFALLFSSLGILINPIFGFGIFAGYLLHLYVDRFCTFTGNKDGLRYLYWPYIKKKAV